MATFTQDADLSSRGLSLISSRSSMASGAAGAHAFSCGDGMFLFTSTLSQASRQT